MRPYYEHAGITIFHGDVLACLRELPEESVHCVVTSPPYWGLRDYGAEGQLGLEKTPQEYVAKMVEVFREVRRVLRKDGTCWVNLGDSYVANATGGLSQKASLMTGGRATQKEGAKRPNKIVDGLKPKDLCGIPWRVAFGLQEDGWWLRQDIIWAKPNPMPESVTDRCTKSHEYLFLLTKSARYHYDAEAISEICLKVGTPGHLKSGNGNRHENHKAMAGAGWNSEQRNKRSVWTIATEAFPEAHFATFPQKLVEPCILAGCPAGGTVLDPFGGSMTTVVVAQRLGHKAIAIELNAEYIDMGLKRLTQDVMQFDEVSA